MYLRKRRYELLRAFIGVAFVLGFLSGCSDGDMDTPSNGLDFSALVGAQDVDTALAPLQRYEARDGTSLAYRHYPADSPVWLVLIHGSATDSVYLQSLAQQIAATGAAHVVTPDLRGHGPSPAVRGDIAYIDQLEDDLADLLAHLRSASGGPRRIVVGGHSSGGGLALRFAGGDCGEQADGYLLLAPYLGHAAPTTRPGSGGWAEALTARIVPIALANTVGIHAFNGVTTLRFNLPDAYRTGGETLTYSYRLMTGFAPRDYATDLAAIHVPALLLAGSRDEAFYARRYASIVAKHNPGIVVDTIDNASHLGLVMREDTASRIVDWLSVFDARP